MAGTSHSINTQKNKQQQESQRASRPFQAIRVLLMNLRRGFPDSEGGEALELSKALHPREEKFPVMALNSIYLVFETWCTFMNLYKHLVHLKSTTGKQSVLSFCVQFWSFHQDILVLWRDPVCEPNQTASYDHRNCDRVICSLKGLLLAQKRCHTSELLNQVSRKQEKHS